HSTLCAWLLSRSARSEPNGCLVATQSAVRLAPILLSLQRRHCLAGHVRLELANVILKKPLKMLGEFSLDYGTFWDQRLFALELRRRGYAARAYCDDLQQAFPCGRWLRRATSLRRHN